MAVPAEQLPAVQKLRDQLVDISDWDEVAEDAFLYRWLKCKDMDADKAKESLQATYKWRKERGIDKILDGTYKPDAELMKYVTYEIVGTDKEGCPVVAYDVEKLNLKKIYDKYGKANLEKYLDYLGADFHQKMVKMSTKEKPVQQLTVIIDAKKFTFKMMTVPGVTEMALETIGLAETHYPDMLKLLCVVNAPKVAKLAYKIVKPFIQEKNLQKVKIFPKLNKKVPKLLLQYIDADQLPEKYGGTKKVASMAVDKGINEDDDGTGNPEELDDGDMIETKLSPGKKLKLEYDIEKPKSQICWSFQTDDREIGFNVFLNDKENVIIPYKTFGSLNLETNSLTCEQPGKYVLCFNNKENRFRSCTLSYAVAVYSPEEADD